MTFAKSCFCTRTSTWDHSRATASVRLCRLRGERRTQGLKLGVNPTQRCADVFFSLVFYLCLFLCFVCCLRRVEANREELCRGPVRHVQHRRQRRSLVSDPCRYCESLPSAWHHLQLTALVPVLHPTERDHLHCAAFRQHIHCFPRSRKREGCSSRSGAWHDVNSPVSKP